MAYAAMYDSVKSFLNLEEDSCEAFRHFVEVGHTEHYIWEVCLVPNIHLYPKLINDRFYLDICFDNKVDNYDKLIHLILEMRKKGYPIIKPKKIEERINPHRLISIRPSKDSFVLIKKWKGCRILPMMQRLSREQALNRMYGRWQKYLILKRRCLKKENYWMIEHYQKNRLVEYLQISRAMRDEKDKKVSL